VTAERSEAPNDYGLILIEIGGAGHLDEFTLLEMASAPAMAHTRYPDAPILLSLSGYDQDPRSIWDIPEAADYVRAYARAAGLYDWHSSLWKALDETTRGLLIACNAINKPHPFTINIVPDPT
jgi:hypothetical protein